MIKDDTRRARVSAPQPNAQSQPLSLCGTLCITAVMLIIALLLLKVSPLGTSERADKYAQDLFNSFLGDYLYPSSARDDSLVLLLTDQALDKYQQGRWPADYNFHGRVLDTLRVYQPAQVFIDFYWMNAARPGASYLIKVLQKYRAAGIPVYIAVKSTEQFQALWPELDGLVIPVSPKIELDPSDFVARSYAPYDAQLQLPTAAFRLARDQGVPLPALQTLPTMQIFWGTSPDPFNTSWMTPGSTAQTSTAARLTQGFSALNQHLPYSPTLFVRDLLNPVPTEQNSPLGDEAQAYLEAQERIQGRTIFYGGSISGARDVVFTPLRDLLPGVFYHAMAYDNLKAWHGQYKSDTPHAAGERSAIPLILLDIAALLPVILVVCLHHFRGIGQPSVERINRWLGDRSLWQPPFLAGMTGYRTLGVRVSLVLIHVLVRTLLLLLPLAAVGIWILLCAWIEFSVFNLAASTWVGYAGVLTLGFLIEKAEWFKRLQQYWHATRVTTSHTDS